MKPMPDGYFNREVCQPYFHAGSDNGILLIHGFTGTAAHMRLIAEGLAQKGYTVQTINLPGHATSEEDMKSSDWQQWLQAAKEAVLSLKKQVRHITVGGLSMGGVLALLAAEEMQIDACVTISAPMAVKNRLLPLAGLAAPVLPRISWGPVSGRAKVLDQRYDFGYTGFPTAKGADLQHLMTLARKNLFSVTCPILSVQSDSDDTVTKSSIDVILDGVSSKKRTRLMLHGVPHVCTISCQAPAIIDAIDKLMTAVDAD